MKSSVSKLYDRSLATVPAEMRTWRVSDDEVEKQLTVLSRSHAAEVQVNQVQDGDSVRLSCEDGTLKDRAVLVFPGLGLPDAAEMEKAVLGRSVGDTVSAAIAGAPLRLKVEEIIRRVPAELSDGLVQLEGLDGVNTLEEYRRYYQKDTEAQNKKQAQKMISSFILNEIVDKSEYDLDHDELEAWTEEQARAEYDAAVEDGEDPCLTEDGERLTEEQAIEALKESLARQFKTNLVSHALCREAGIPLKWEDLKGEFEAMFPPELAAMISPEEMEESKAMFMENAAVTKIFDLLFEEAAAYLEV